ncbi:MAG TPA: hypothetical protein ENJ00_05870 [Phycisphaerales bacterium]|nr:hypothetical protein [Phycisphaerales bacterium]
MILSGEKTAELRLTRNRIVPFGRVFAGERLYFKIASGPICASAEAAQVELYEDLIPAEIVRLRQSINHAVRGDSAFWRFKANARYATLVYLADVKPCVDGPDISRARAANPRSAWLMLDG